MAKQTVKLIYGKGKRDSLVRAAAVLMSMHLAFYYSKDFIRVKTRRPERATTVSQEFKALRLKVSTRVYED